MNKENNQNDIFKQAQQGSGSAEQTGRSREQQKNRSEELSDAQKRDIAQDAGLNSEDIADLKDMGALSGRDDASGGSNDGMENESTNEPTDRMR